jgi:dienelactone hydrolase
MKKTIVVSVVFVVSLLVLGATGFTPTAGRAAATEAATPQVQPSEITVKVSDGLEIKGSFYASEGKGQASAALLLHQYKGSRSEWDPFTQALVAKGYNVLVVDQRGYGKTGGTEDWKLAVTDAAALMGWLRKQPTVNPDRVTVAGASVGANVALQVCASDLKCHTVIALSPGTDFLGVTSKDAVQKMEKKPIFLAASQEDPYASDATVKSLVTDAPVSSTVLAKVYANNKLHGAAMFQNPDLIPTMLLWLDTYNIAAVTK